MKTNEGLLWEGLLIVLTLGCIFYMVANHSFGAKCKRAGYEEAKFELCVNRVSQGGPVYEENIKYWRTNK